MRRDGQSNHPSEPLTWCAWLCFALSIAAFPLSLHAGTLQAVALSGQGEFAGGFSQVVLSENGSVAFVAELTGTGIDSTNNIGLLSGLPGSVSLVAQKGAQAPGLDAGVNFVGDFADLKINNAGQTAFASSVSGPGVTFTNDTALWSEGGGPLGLIAREGSDAAGFSVGTRYASFFAGQALNDVGRSAFAGGLTGAGVTSSNNVAIWSQPGGTTTPLARSGSQAPSAPAGANFQTFNAPVVNNLDQTAFHASLVGGGVNSSNNAGIWSDRSGVLDLDVRTGGAAPGISGATFGSLGDPRLSDSGDIAFRATLTGSEVDASNNVGLWAERGGPLSLVARTGQMAPGVGDAVFSSLTTPTQNDAGLLAFDGFLSGDGVNAANDRGVWAQNSQGVLNLVIREGDAAPGTSAGVTFSNFSAPLLNDDGQVALLGYLQGTGVDASNARGIWATDRMGILQLIAREGDQLEIAPSEFRVVSLLANPRAAQLPGLSFSKRGEYAFWATFTDGSSGVFVSTLVAVPEPTSAVMLVGVCLCSGALRRDR